MSNETASALQSVNELYFNQVKNPSTFSKLTKLNLSKICKVYLMQKYYETNLLFTCYILNCLFLKAVLHH